MEVRRGDLVTIALQGDYGKPRYALVVQSDLFDEDPSITVLPVTGELLEAPLFRIRVEPDALNGLQKSSDIIVGKAQSVPRGNIREGLSQLSEEKMFAVSRSLSIILGVL